jgi:hypothetical protein
VRIGELNPIELRHQDNLSTSIGWRYEDIAKLRRSPIETMHGDNYARIVCGRPWAKKEYAKRPCGSGSVREHEGTETFVYSHVAHPALPD